LDPSFNETASSSFSIQHQLTNVLKFGKTGDWVQVTSELDHSFGVVANVTGYSMHLVAKDPVTNVKTGDTFVASDFDASFNDTVSVSFSIQHQLTNVLKFGKTGDWVQ